MVNKKWVWTRTRKNLRRMLTTEPGDKETYTPDSLKAFMRGLREKAAKEQGWSPVELALTISADVTEIDEVVKRMKG